MMFSRRKRSIVRLLLVEDEPLVAFDTEHLLIEQSYEVVATVDRVSDALAVIAAHGDLHLVLVDLMLADGSGIDVARAAQGRGIPVIFVTGSSPDGAEMFAAGWLSKPYAQRDLLAAIIAVEAPRDGRKPRRLPNGFQLFASPAPIIDAN